MDTLTSGTRNLFKKKVESSNSDSKYKTKQLGDKSGCHQIIGLSSPEFTLVDYPTMDDKEIISPLKSSGRMKQEKNVI